MIRLFMVLSKTDIEKSHNKNTHHTGTKAIANVCDCLFVYLY